MEREIVEKVKDCLLSAAGEIRQKKAIISERQEELSSGRFNENHIRNVIFPEIRLLKSEIEKTQNDAVKAATAILDDYEKQLDDLDALNPSDINEDAKLFDVGVTLTEKDLRSILDRNQDNRTMTILALRYAKENGIDMGVSYVGSARERHEVANMKTIIWNYGERWISRDNVEDMIDRLFSLPED